MIVGRHETSLAFMGRSRDPNVIGWNRGSVLLEMGHELSVDFRGSHRDWMNQNLWFREKFPKFALVFLELRSLSESVVQFADHGCRQDDAIGDGDSPCHRPLRRQSL